jgi:glycopeptide antibiotics resistance protein
MRILSRVWSRRGLIVAAVVLVILVLTLLPSGNSPPRPFSLHVVLGRRWLADGFLNICLFVPLGLAAGWDSRSPLKAILAGILLSTGIELAQTIVPGRDPSLSDIVFNTIGVLSGAMIVRRLGRRGSTP